MLMETLGEQIRRIVQQSPEISLVYLFGSQVTGQTGTLSDYDFALLLTPHADRRSLRASFAHAVALALGTERIDVVLLDQVPIELAYAVIAEGQLLFQRDNATRVEYEALNMSKYGDYLPVLRAQQRDILKGADHAIRVQRYREALGRTERTLGAIAAAASKIA